MEPRPEEIPLQIEEIHVDVDEVLKMMNEVALRKSMGPDGVAEWSLRECTEQTRRPI